MVAQAAAATAAPAAAPAASEAVPTGQHDAADAAMYREMRAALSDFDSSASPKNAAPRHRAFYAALRSVLGQVLEEKSEASRHTRLLAAHQWFVKHKPRPKPADMDMAAAMAASLSVSGPAAQDLSTNLGVIEEEHQAISRSNTSRWREQQVRLHELEDECSTTAEQQGPCSLPGSPQQHEQYQCRGQAPGHLGTSDFFASSGQGGGVSTGAAAAGGSRAGSAPGSKVAACLPEQPSLRQMPAIQAVQGLRQQQQQQQQQQRAASSTGQADQPSRSVSPARAMICSSRTAVGSAAGTTDGLIPLGSLPSSGRFGQGAGGSSSSSSSGSYGANRAQWCLVSAQQQQVELDVAAHMRGYARHRARLEEEISRKQETAAHIAATQATMQQQEAAGGTSLGDGGRVLHHLDSQHQPSAISTFQRLTPVAAPQLVPVDKVKEAKKQLMQEGQREVAEVAAQLSSLGIAADTDLVTHALLPLPDMPYMHCMAHLPKPGATGTRCCKKVKVKKGKKKVKSKGQKGGAKAKKQR